MAEHEDQIAAELRAKLPNVKVFVGPPPKDASAPTMADLARMTEVKGFAVGGYVFDDSALLWGQTVESPPPYILPHRMGYQLGLEVEQAVMRNHEEAVAAWRAGKLPTVEPPASSIFPLDVSTS